MLRDIINQVKKWRKSCVGKENSMKGTIQEKMFFVKVKKEEHC